MSLLIRSFLMLRCICTVLGFELRKSSDKISVSLSASGYDLAHQIRGAVKSNFKMPVFCQLKQSAVCVIERLKITNAATLKKQHDIK